MAQIGARRLLVLLLALAAPAAPAAAQQLSVTSSLPADGFVDPDTPVEITLSRPLQEGERIALWIGDEDVSGLVRATGTTLRYEPDVVPLPVGTGELRAFLVSDGTWDELAALPLRVRSRAGFESGSANLRLSAGLDGQVAEGHVPAENAPERETYEDLEGELTMELEQAHRAFTLQGSAQVFGTSHREDALRFREEARDAPRVDLAEYALTVKRRDAALTLGHLRTGGHRHLIQGLASRGAELALEAGSRVRMSAAVTGATRVVGWDDAFGAGDPDHRIWNASVGVEAAPTPGALRVDLTFMGGSVLPRSGFNRGAVVDAETSRGMGLRIRAQGLDRRLSLDAGLARSSFDNPEDPGLEQGLDLVDVERESADARYLDASLALLRGISLGSRTADLSVGVRHERVDPLYRSVGARVGADNLTNELDVQATVAGAALRATFASDEDNLDDVASVLKSHTDRTGLTLGLPAARILGSRSPWLPRIQLRMDRTHQFGEALPENGGFDPSHVPDQVSTRKSASADWRWERVSLGYRWDASHQDNRQEGREESDLKGSTNTVSLGLAPLPSLDLGLDLGLERSENLERDEVEDTRNLGASLRWRPFDRSTLSLRWSRTASEDRAGTRERIARTLDAQLSSAVPGLAPVQGQLFVRFSRRESERTDATLELSDRRETWTVTTGLSVTLQNR